MKFFPVLVFFASCVQMNAQLESYATLAESRVVKEAPHYRFPQFKLGSIIRKDDTPFEGLLNYNLATEEVVVYMGNRKMPYPLDQIVSVHIDSIDIYFDGQLLNELIYEDAISLFVHRKCILARLGQNTGLGRSSTINSKELPPEKKLLYELVLPGTFEQRDVKTYFLKLGNSQHRIDNLKDVLHLFPLSHADLKKFIKKERIKFSRESDLIRLVEFCNSL